MSIFTYELKKIMLYHKGLLYIAVFLVLCVIGLIVTDNPQNYDMEQYQNEYNWYLDRVSGYCTSQTAAYLENEARGIAEAQYRQQILAEQYYKGEMDDETYKQQKTELEEISANQNGFEVIYQQYLYICENPENRYFVQTNGWSGLLDGKTFNFILFLVIMLLAVPVFCSEYCCGMDTLLITSGEGRKSAVYKILIILAGVFLLALLYSLLRYLFYTVKYGLPNGNYPIQSLSDFGSSSKSISLLGTYLLITIFQCFGCVFFVLLLLLWSILLKKYALTLLSGAISMLVPYIALPETLIYRLPLPLPFFMGTGFLVGSSYVEDPVTGQQIARFCEVEIAELVILLLLSTFFCLFAGYWVLRCSSNFWQTLWHSSRPALVFVLLLGVITFTGCSSADNISVVYNSSVSDTCCGYEAVFDPAAQSYILSCKETKEMLDLVRSPLFGAFGTEESAGAYFCSEPYIYYTRFRTERYVDRVGEYNSSFTKISVVQLNLGTFEEKVIFEKIIDSARSVLGIEYETGSKWEFLQFCQNFFLNESKIFFVGSNTITRVDRRTHQTEHFDRFTASNVAFDGRNIYYLNKMSELTKYNTEDSTKTVFDVIASDFLLDKQQIYYIDITDDRHIYTCDLNGSNKTLFYELSSLAITFDGDNLCITPLEGGEAVYLPKQAQERE